MKLIQERKTSWLGCRIEPGLRKQFSDYARENNLTITGILIGHVRKILQNKNR